MTKYVNVELNHTGKIYEYATELNLEVGKAYKVTTDGWDPPMRVKVLSVSDNPTYTGILTEILTADEVETF